MTRATLSGILHHLGSLTDAEVTELEKLAENFPYCQTAHTLLAKALHDRGSMLAGQKLRRAATYAADRRVLRRLLMTPPVEAAAVAEEAVETPTLAVDAAGALVAAPEAAPQEEKVTAETPVMPEADVVALADEAASTLASLANAGSSPVSETAPATPPVIADFDLVPDTSPALEELKLFEAEENVEPTNPALGLLTDTIPVALLAEAPPVVPLLEADPAVSYYVGSSRLGIELVSTESWPGGEADLLSAWLSTAPPDARWTEHAAAHEPPRPVVPRRPFEHQFALIDRFLREKPRLRTMDPTQPLPEKVPDLAQRSARDSGALVSESMARILARQGKTGRAIAMYEQLQLKFPEKAATFAAQIAALRSSEA